MFVAKFVWKWRFWFWFFLIEEANKGLRTGAKPTSKSELLELKVLLKKLEEEMIARVEDYITKNTTRKIGNDERNSRGKTGNEIIVAIK